jgi:hypothetical protein
MAQITVDSDAFQNIIACFLLEAIQTREDGKYMFSNELFNQLLDHMWNAGIRSNLLFSYLSMDGNDRVLYRMIRKALFNEGNSNSLIRVDPIEEKDETK